MCSARIRPHSKARPELPLPVVVAALRGNRIAMARLYRVYRPRVRRVVGRIAWCHGRGDDLEELCQETWCRLLTHDARLLRYFDPRRGSFGSFVCRLAWQQARRAILAEQRHQRDRVELGEGGIERLSERDAPRELLRVVLTLELLQHAHHCLHPHDYALLLHCRIEGYGLQELAQALSVSPNALYKRNQRLCSKLRRVQQSVHDCAQCCLLSTRSSPSADPPPAPTFAPRRSSPAPRPVHLAA